MCLDTKFYINVICVHVKFCSDNCFNALSTYGDKTISPSNYLINLNQAFIRVSKPGEISPRVSLRTGLERLHSSGSRYQAIGLRPIFQWANNFGCVAAHLLSHFQAFASLLLSFLYFFLAHITNVRFTFASLCFISL